MTDASHQPTELRFYLQKLRNEAIESLRLLNLTWFSRPHNVLAHLLDGCIRTEIERRFWNEENQGEPLIGPDFPILDLENWSDAGVADGLEVVATRRQAATPRELKPWSVGINGRIRISDR
jgi:hypothetical protein